MYLCVCVCMSVCECVACMCKCLQRLEYGIRSSKTRQQVVVSHQGGCWKLSSGPLLEQSVLLITELSLQHIFCILF